MKASNFQKMKFLVIVPVFAILMISGCTNQGGVTLGNGVKILNWEPDFSSVESGEKVELRLNIQNKGEVTARNVYAVLLGISPQEWGISGNPGIEFRDLPPPDIVQNVDSAPVSDSFKVVAPSLPYGSSQQYYPQVRVYYTYSTTANKLITLVKEDELRRLQDKGETLKSSETKVTAGPLNVKINTGKFIKAKPSSGLYTYSNKFPITIDIENIGGGVVVGTIPSTTGWTGWDPWGDITKEDYEVTVFIDIPSSRLQIEDCNPIKDNKIKLWKGKDASITCNVKITDPPFANEDVNIKVNLIYSYYIDSRTTITVTGTK